MKIWYDSTFRLTHLLLFYCCMCTILNGESSLSANIDICTHTHIHIYKCSAVRTLCINCICNHANSCIISLPILPPPTLWSKFSSMLHYLVQMAVLPSSSSVYDNILINFCSALLAENHKVSCVCSAQRSPVSAASFVIPFFYPCLPFFYGTRSSWRKLIWLTYVPERFWARL